MQTPARHFPAMTWTACLITAVILCSSANHARAQEELVTADPEDLLAIAQLANAIQTVEVGAPGQEYRRLVDMLLVCT